MKIPAGSIVLMLSFGLTAVAPPAQAEMFQFSGTVTQSSGVYGAVPIGSTITGTYNFELSNASPSESSGVIGSQTTSWDADLFGGSFYVGPRAPVDSVVFSSSASVDGFSYTSFTTPSDYLTGSQVLAQVNPFLPPFYEASEEICFSSASCHSSSLLGDAYTSDGLPDFASSPDGSWRGGFSTGVQNGPDSLQYSINSLSPVPLPPSITLLASGIVGFWFVRRRQQGGARSLA
jgi:hypothetical protein